MWLAHVAQRCVVVHHANSAFLGINKCTIMIAPSGWKSFLVCSPKKRGLRFSHFHQTRKISLNPFLVPNIFQWGSYINFLHLFGVPAGSWVSKWTNFNTKRIKNNPKDYYFHGVKHFIFVHENENENEKRRNLNIIMASVRCNVCKFFHIPTAITREPKMWNINRFFQS